MSINSRLLRRWTPGSSTPTEDSSTCLNIYDQPTGYITQTLGQSKTSSSDHGWQQKNVLTSLQICLYRAYGVWRTLHDRENVSATQSTNLYRISVYWYWWWLAIDQLKKSFIFLRTSFTIGTGECRLAEADILLVLIDACASVLTRPQYAFVGICIDNT